MIYVFNQLIIIILVCAPLYLNLRNLKLTKVLYNLKFALWYFEKYVVLKCWLHFNFKNVIFYVAIEQILVFK